MISKYKKSKWTNTLLTLVLILIVGMVGLTGCRKATKDASNNDTIDITAAAEDITTAAEDITPATEGTGTSEVTTAPITPTPELTAAPITPTPELIATPGSSQATDQSDLKDLVALMGLSKDELIIKLGKDYKKVDEGGLEFTQPEIRVWFNEKSITNQVYTDKSDIDFNGAKVGDDIKSFTEVFGKALRDNNEVSLFKVDDNYLSVYYDTNTKKTYAVYLLTEEVAAPVK